jgi:hypothetical protein
MITVIFWVCLGISIVSFFTFLGLTFGWGTGSGRPASGAGKTVQQSGLTDTAKLAEAAAKLAEAFGKAGPAATAAVICLISLAFAVLAAGLDRLPVR